MATVPPLPRQCMDRTYLRVHSMDCLLGASLGLFGCARWHCRPKTQPAAHKFPSLVPAEKRTLATVTAVALTAVQRTLTKAQAVSVAARAVMSAVDRSLALTSRSLSQAGRQG